MANNNKNTGLPAFAPYNFIPFYEGKVPVRYEKGADRTDQLPAFDARNEGTLSGYVNYKIRVLTDLAIGDSQSEADRKAGKPRPFYRDAQKRLVIPGSEMRGLIRSTAEILSLTRPESVAADRYMYRGLGGNCKNLRDEYKTDLLGEMDDTNGCTRTPEGVEAGLLCKEGSRYYIRPMARIPGTSRTYLRVSEKTLIAARERGYLSLNNNQLLFLKKAEPSQKGGMQGKEAVDPEQEIDKYDLQTPNNSYRPYRGVRVSFRYAEGKPRFSTRDGKPLPAVSGDGILPDEENSGAVQNAEDLVLPGELLNSAYIGNRGKDDGPQYYADGQTLMPNGKSHHYLVHHQPLLDAEGEDHRIWIDPKDASEYTHDYERNCIQNKNLERNRGFYALPDKDGEFKTFFYKCDKNGNLMGFGPTPNFRIFYRHAMQEGMRMTYDRSKGLDYVDSLFGYMSRKIGSTASADNKQAERFDPGYKSRLSFQNAVYGENQPEDMDADRQMILLAPKGSSFPMYVNQSGHTLKGRGKEGLITYNNDQFRLNGSKVYWKRQKAMVQLPEANNMAIFSHMEVLRAGKDQNRYFAGRVRFDHLYEDELGLLLLSLQYKAAGGKGTETRLLGSGKPYGYGKIEITIEDVRIIDEHDRYSLINPVAAPVAGEQIETYKQAFINKVAAAVQADKGGRPSGKGSSGTGAGSDEENRKLYEQLETIRAYRAWIALNYADSYLERYKDLVYMPISGSGNMVPVYGKCEPLESMETVLAWVREGQKTQKQQGGNAARGSAQTHRRTRDRKQIPKYYRFTVIKEPQNDQFFLVKPDDKDQDTNRVFKHQTEARCMIDRPDKDYPSDLSRIKPGMIIYALSAKDTPQKDKKGRKIQVLAAVDWYTEEE